MVYSTLSRLYFARGVIVAVNTEWSTGCCVPKHYSCCGSSQQEFRICDPCTLAILFLDESLSAILQFLSRFAPSDNISWHVMELFFLKCLPFLSEYCLSFRVCVYMHFDLHFTDKLHGFSTGRPQSMSVSELIVRQLDAK